LAGAVDVPGDTGPGSAAEWNLSLDPDAADAVLHSGVGITFIPLDATVEGAPPGDIAILLDGADSVTGRLFPDLAERGAADGQPALLRDPLAASVVVDESVAAYQMIAIAIDGEGVVSRSSDGVRVRVAVSMDDDRFAETFTFSSIAPSDREEAVSPLADAPNGRVVWRFDLESTPLAAGGAKSRSGVADGVAYFVGLDDRIYALDAATGDKLWSRDLEEEGPSFVEVALSPEAFFFQNQTFDPDTGPDPTSSSIESVDRGTGEEIWRVQLDGPTQGGAGNPAYQDGLVYYTAEETGLLAADALTGETVWTFDAPAFPNAGLASVVDGTVYFGALDGSVYALDANTGEQRWRAKTRLSGFGVTSSPAVADGVIYFGSDSGQFLAVDAESGEVIWEFEVQPVQGLPSSPAIADGIVYFGVLAPAGGSAFGGLIALDAASGEELWRFGGPDLDMISSPAYENGVVYVLAPAGDTGVGGLAALDGQSGTVLWWFELDGAPSDSPVVVDGTVYFQANGSFFAVEAPA
jgi:outer membrane protein assembly factor BamB